MASTLPPIHQGAGAPVSNLSQTQPMSNTQQRGLRGSRRGSGGGGATQSFSLATLEPDSNANTIHHNTCLELLVTGHVGAFIELFNLTSRDPDQAGLAEDKEKLGLLQLGLSRRDAAVQSGDAGKAYTALTQLGDDFEAGGDLGMARHFRESSLAAADPLGTATSARAHGAYGLVLEKQGNLKASIEQLSLMRSKSDADTSEACNHLVRVLISLSEGCEAAGNMDESLLHLTHALSLAQEGNNEPAVTECRFRLGRAFVTLGDPEKAIESLEKYMDSAGNDAEGMNKAFEVLATCYERLGDLDRAGNYLERLVETSSRAGQMTIASHASARLGDIYGSTGELEQSVHWYNHAFNTARDLDDLAWITKCQIQLGRSRAAAMRTGFQDCLSNNKMLDVVRILMWKSHREESFSSESSMLGFSKPGTAASRESAAAVAAMVAKPVAAAGGEAVAEAAKQEEGREEAQAPAAAAEGGDGEATAAPAAEGLGLGSPAEEGTGGGDAGGAAAAPAEEGGGGGDAPAEGEAAAEPAAEEAPAPAVATEETTPAAPEAAAPAAEAEAPAAAE